MPKPKARMESRSTSLLMSESPTNQTIESAPNQIVA